MKKFLKHIGIFTILLIIPCIGFEIMLRHIPNSFRFKRELIETEGHRMKNIIIGSSVAIHGINPNYLPDSTYNLAFRGEWFRYNYKLLETYIDKMPELQNIIWGICYQALWEDNNEARNETNIIYHNIYTGIHPDKDNIFYQSELLSTGSVSFRKWSKYYLSRKSTMPCDQSGFDHGADIDTTNNPPKWLNDLPMRLKEHTGLSQNDMHHEILEKNIRQMDSIAKLCNERNIKLHIVVCPAYLTYHEQANKAQLDIIEATIQGLQDRWKDISYYNYFKDGRFGINDFSDCNHLSSNIGATKFSKILQQDLHLKK